MSDDWRAETVEKLRSLLVRAEPDLVEEAKWRKASNPDGVPTFSCDGLICTVETYQGQDQADFAQGAAPSTSTRVRLSTRTRSSSSCVRRSRTTVPELVPALA